MTNIEHVSNRVWKSLVKKYNKFVGPVREDRTCRPIHRRRFTAAWLLIATTIMGCAGAFESGMESLQQGDPHGARQAAADGLIDDPSDAALHYLMAEALLALLEPRGAVDHARAALASEDLPEEYRGRTHRVASEAYQQLGQLVEAALQAHAAQSAGGWDNEGALRTLLRDGVTQALATERPGDALTLLRSLDHLNRAASASDAQVRVLILPTARAAAQQLVDLGELEAAWALLDGLQDDFPEARELLLLQGVLALRLADDDRAIQTFERYIDSVAAGNAERLLEVAQQMASLGRWDLSIAYYERTRASDPSLVAALAGLAEALFQTARYDRAVEVLDGYLDQAAANDDLSLAQAYLDCHIAARDAGQTDLALAYLERANHALHDVVILRQLVEAYLRRGRLGQAETLMREFVDQSDDPGRSAEEVGDWYMQRGRPGFAADFYREATQNPSGTPADAQRWLKLAQAYGAIDASYDLISAIEIFLELSPNDDGARREAAGLLASVQEWLEAARVLRPLFDAQPSNEQLAIDLAEAYHSGGAESQEQEIWARLLENHEEPAQMTLRIGRIWAERGRYRQAITWFERATDLEEVRRDAQLELAELYRRLGEWAAMWAVLDTYIDEQGGSFEAYRRVLDGFQERRFARQAVVLLDRMLEAAPENNDLRLELAERLLQLHDTDRVRTMLIQFILEAYDHTQAAERAVWLLTRRGHADLALELLDLVVERARLTSSAADIDLSGITLTTATLYNDLARDLMAAGDVAGAQDHRAASRRFFAAYLESEPTNLSDLIRAAGEMRLAGLDDLASACFGRVQALGGSMNGSRRDFAFSLIRSGGAVERASLLLEQVLPTVDDAPRFALEVVAELRDQGHLREAVEWAQRAQRLAQNDAERTRSFRAGGTLLVESGRHEDLLVLSNSYVAESADQLSALRTAVELFVLSGMWEPARERLQLALSLAPGDAALIRDFATLDLAQGNIDTSISRFGGLARAAAQPWRAWLEYASFFEAHGHLDAARAALREAHVAGGEAWELLLALGVAEARFSDLEAAQAAFDASLDVSFDAPTARQETFVQIVRVLAHLGYQGLADRYLERALVDRDTRAAFILTAAERALQRGELNRARQFLRAHLDEGGESSAVIDLQLAYDLVAEAVGLLSEIVLEGGADSAAPLVARHADVIARQLGSSTLVVWENVLSTRGAETEDLRLSLARILTTEGRLGDAALLLRQMADDHPELLLDVASLQSARGQAGEAMTLLQQVLARPEWDTDARDVALRLAVLGVVGVGDTLDRFFADTAADGAHSTMWSVARLEWLLAHGRIREAVESWTEIRSDSDAQQILTLEAFDRYGHNDEAAALALDLGGRSSTPGTALRSAVVHAYQVGHVADADAALARYRQLAANHAPSLLALARMMADHGLVGPCEALSADLISRFSPRVAREALSLVARAALVAGQPARVDDSIQLFLTRPGNDYRNRLEVAAQLERLYRFADAADHYLIALELVPGDPSPLNDALRNSYRAGRGQDVIELVAAGGSLSQTMWFEPFASAHDMVHNPSLEAAVVDALLRIDPGGFQTRVRQVALALQQDEPNATQQLRELVELAPEDPLNMDVLLRGLATIDHPAVIAVATEVVGRSATPQSTALQAARILERAGQLDSLDAALDVASEQSWSWRSAAQVAELASDFGRHELAVELARRAQDINPVGAYSYAIEAAALIRAGDESRARVARDRFDTLVQRPASGLALMARAALESGSDAEPLLVALVEQTSLDERGRVQLSGLNSVVELLYQYRPERVVSFVTARAPELFTFPAAIGRVDLLAGAEARSGSSAEALRIVERASVVSDPDIGQMADQVLFLIGVGEIDAAQTLAFQAIAESAQPSPYPLLALAHVRAAQGRAEGTEVAISVALRLVQRPDDDQRLQRLLRGLED